jgi:hypothetical protein
MSDEAPPAHVVSGVGGIESQEEFGTPDVYETAREEWLIEGYRRALTRFRTATHRRDDPEFRRETFIPLFEALDFAASLIERVEPKSASKGKPTEESSVCDAGHPVRPKPSSAPVGLRASRPRCAAARDGARERWEPHHRTADRLRTGSGSRSKSCPHLTRARIPLAAIPIRSISTETPLLWPSMRSSGR